MVVVFIVHDGTTTKKEVSFKCFPLQQYPARFYLPLSSNIFQISVLRSLNLAPPVPLSCSPKLSTLAIALVFLYASLSSIISENMTNKKALAETGSY